VSRTVESRGLMCFLECLTRYKTFALRVLGESVKEQTTQDLMQGDPTPYSETSASNGAIVSEGADLEECRSRRGGGVVPTPELAASPAKRSSSFTLRSTAESKSNDEWQAKSVPDDRNDDCQTDNDEGLAVPASTGPFDEIEPDTCDGITESLRSVNMMDSPLTTGSEEEAEEEETRRRRGGGLVQPSRSVESAVKRPSSLTLRSAAESMDGNTWEKPEWTENE
jgi:hypothetical protein